MSQVNLGSVGGVGEPIDFGHTGSLQLRFARLQLALSEAAKAGAMKNIDDIEKSQAEQKYASEMLQKARQLLEEAKKSGKPVEFPQELKDFMDKHGLAYDKSGVQKTLEEIGSLEETIGDYKNRIPVNEAEIKKTKNEIGELEKKFEKARGLEKAKLWLQIAGRQVKNAALEGANVYYKVSLNVMDGRISDLKAQPVTFNKEQWETVTASLKAYLDTLGTNTQQKMVFVQDFMGQFNSYLQGANTAIQQSNQTLAELARLR